MTPDELIRKWDSVLYQARHLFTWTEPHCLAYLCEHASRSNWIIESGTYMGASAFVMLKANPLCHLWCIDKFEVAGTKKVTEYFLADEIKVGRCELIVGDSELGAKNFDGKRGMIDMAWIDDGHHEDDVLRDIRCLLPLLRPGGLLCGHDFDGDNDVARGVQQSGIDFTVPVPRLWAHVKK